MNDLISRQAAIDAVKRLSLGETDATRLAMRIGDYLERLPSAQPEPWEDERKKIADALSEKMAYMNTCLNERDIILGYLGVKRPNETHCNSDCRNEKCESYHYATKELPSEQPEQQWIPCSEGLPEDLEEVNVTWVNHDPEPYYDFVKDKPFTATAVYYKEKWYWYSSTCADILAEYGRNPNEEIDDGIEIIAWMPLPEPWKEKPNEIH